ncbi:hypothetical protein H5410_020561 [Solanum commersonii]|uniref:Uncharacterized protein n=1 Tax=Solanum commersonii TaxID=4109 RepID=A0A9J5ZBM7_SOLCO|nr:hypothetical protein H5410_020561 [Solanum commersonii]
MILSNNKTTGNEIYRVLHVLPAIHINYTDEIHMHISRVQRLSSEKSRLHLWQISLLKILINSLPDITAPGVDIIVAYSEAVNPTEENYDKRTSPYNMISGTSMSCPHVAGVVGLLKKAHPDWSPAAIRSAIMTTGHLRPNGAMDPDLVYDLTHQKGPNNLLDFNYPSIKIPNISPSSPITITRRLKNVGAPGRHTGRVCLPPRIFSASVKPRVLEFDHVGQEESFNVTIKVLDADAVKDTYVFGELRWTDHVHYVRSPIAIASMSDISYKN